MRKKGAQHMVNREWATTKKGTSDLYEQFTCRLALPGKATIVTALNPLPELQPTYGLAE